MDSLLAGCQKLGLESHVADELLHYLIVKHALLTDNEQTKAAARQMSPSVPMDQLWHWMLLNTSVRDAVHAMVGGDVPHSTDTADDPLPEKQLRRINAQEALKSFGFAVCEAAWGSSCAVEVMVASKREPPPAPVHIKLEDEEDMINIIMKNLDGRELRVRTSPSVRVSRLTQLAIDTFQMAADEPFLVFDAQRMAPDSTLENHGVEDGDTIDVLVRQRGC